MEAFHIKPQTPVESPLRTDKRIRKNCRQKLRTSKGLRISGSYYSQDDDDHHQKQHQHHQQQQQPQHPHHHHDLQQNQQPQQHLGHDHWTCIMMTMLFVISIVLTGNSALAAQRESFKPKDPNTINNNANAILNEISSSNSGSNIVGFYVGGGGDGSGGNGNAASHGNSNNISNGNTNANNVNSNGPTNTAKSFHHSTSTTTAGHAVSGGGGGGFATTTTQISIANRTQGGSSSSSGGSASSSSSSSGSSTLYKSSSHANNRNAIEQPEMVQNGPYFDKAASKNVTALLGKTAYLNCRVKNLGNKTMLLQVSWVRHRDIHLLTVGRYTYTSDQRFRAIHQPQTEDWILQIKYPQHRDSGIYECQVSTTPHMSHYIHLNVVEPSTEIIGAPDLYIESGSTINLTCVILNSPEPPAYIFWNHNNAIINYDSPRGGVSVVTIKGDTTTSFLLIKTARPSDSGHYQCNPSNAKPKSVTVHVLNGVSHSVSRGVPSSNAARGTSSSSNVSKPLYLSVPVHVLVYLSVCQALHKAAGGYQRWCTACCHHVIESLARLLGLFLLTVAYSRKLMLNSTSTIKKDEMHTQFRKHEQVIRVSAAAAAMSQDIKDFRSCCCYCMQLRENAMRLPTTPPPARTSVAKATTFFSSTIKRQSTSVSASASVSSYTSSTMSAAAATSMTSMSPLSVTTARTSVLASAWHGDQHKSATTKKSNLFGGLRLVLPMTGILGGGGGGGEAKCKGGVSEAETSNDCMIDKCQYGSFCYACCCYSCCFCYCCSYCCPFVATSSGSSNCCCSNSNSKNCSSLCIMPNKCLHLQSTTFFSESDIR
ncbi:uncharacterized protein LOC106082487 isoform X1 [Stomoxys calcitrans]|uniref:uncharacterized protein LOC106082487 isoform X1 n=1 Tax=Stomoxys calcitrans TaxID=35570 RepID=UPI0027E28148|nr:uncharacterized protein LOC106082487 isoform X1 [Stomoxys calcitrans]